ncbi:hypothetical protein POVWA1_051580 [Plasmodium ovale wallikeri]|uniref:Uncharacterized protein n=1 Tax=Plasmodium ovale wallikeri TaxID=864142 RepID=A0A1A8ZN43_PLAOA|nr:hypothetical protein POVWA1_051580 [Plasmodium ovale wallikeri]
MYLILWRDLQFCSEGDIKIKVQTKWGNEFFFSFFFLFSSFCEHMRSGEVAKWRSGEVAKRRSGEEAKFGAHAYFAISNFYKNISTLREYREETFLLTLEDLHVIT